MDGVDWQVFARAGEQESARGGDVGDVVQESRKAGTKMERWIVACFSGGEGMRRSFFFFKLSVQLNRDALVKTTTTRVIEGRKATQSSKQVRKAVQVAFAGRVVVFRKHVGDKICSRGS